MPRADCPQTPRQAPPRGVTTTTAWAIDCSRNRRAAQRPAAAHQLAYAPDSNQLRGPVLDEAGRVLQDGGRRYAWDSLGRLASVTQEGITTRYRYNQRGQRIAKRGAQQQHYLYDGQRHRIAELDAHGRLTRQYVWLGDQLLAVIDPPQPLPLRAPVQGVFESLWRTAQAAWEGLGGAAPTIHYVHVNHLGAPVAVTDERGHTTWAADYAPFGQRLVPQAAGIIKTATGQEPPSGVSSLRLDFACPGNGRTKKPACTTTTSATTTLRPGASAPTRWGWRVGSMPMPMRATTRWGLPIRWGWCCLR